MGGLEKVRSVFERALSGRWVTHDQGTCHLGGALEFESAIAEAAR